MAAAYVAAQINLIQHHLILPVESIWGWARHSYPANDAGKEAHMLTAKDDAVLARSVQAMDALVSRL